MTKSKTSESHASTMPKLPPGAPKPPKFDPSVIDDGAWWDWLEDLRQFSVKQAREEHAVSSKS